MEREILNTNRKALIVNLNPMLYGSFAEIGAGQEVARNFFQAGGASGTIAKTISAYDMAYSDFIYCKGKKERYVSQSRLEKMLDIEYQKTTTVLQEIRGDKTCFFAFADTVTTINYKKDNFSHGWMGIRYQLNPNTEPNTIVLHVSLLEKDALLQQNTIGILGVNLIYASIYHYNIPNVFLQSLMDNLSADRLEITMIQMNGPDLAYVDNRLLSVQLVKNGMARATIFDRHGNVQEPADMLYKKDVLAFRGSFRPITFIGFDMLKTSYALFKKNKDYERDNTIPLCEITLNNLLEEGNFDEQDFLNRVDVLNEMGQNVMISNYREYYRLVNYFSQFKIRNLKIVISAHTLCKVMDEQYYSNLKGGILEAFGMLFSSNMQLYVYPSLEEKTQKIITAENLQTEYPLKALFDYLWGLGKIIPIKHYNATKLNTYPHIVLKMIKKGESGWEAMVPKYVEDQIKSKKLFGYK